MGRRPRPPCIEGSRRRAATTGYTLVEVVVAMLLACIMITSVFSVTLTSKTSGGKNDRRLLAAQACRQVTSRLQNYVTGCDCSIATGVCAAPGSGAGACDLQGPTPRAGVASWYFNCPTCTPSITDSQGDVYALKTGSHTITGLLPQTFAGVPFESAPYNARVIYFVSNSQTLNGRPVPVVSVTVDWTEPITP